ncbi:hypothetical protein C0Q70_20814 [Pomacea canaliculata]|uniref:Uncharacterized protein n=1 Tax=Pomacea canaliculata TaxID=400727 RepID=A0A2T7NAS0_POMCA|nr:hypothetical protein C0Q70_20814 [Pomacea canaliculata]
MKIKLKSFHDSSERSHHKFNVQFLRDRRKQEEFNCEVKNKCAALEGLLEETVANLWTGLQETWKTACTHVLGKKSKTAKVMANFQDLAKDRGKERAEQKTNQCQDQQQKEEHRAKYWEINREVKKSASDDNRQFANRMAEEAEQAAGQNNMRRLYEITRILSGRKNTNACTPVKNANGSVINGDAEQ